MSALPWARRSPCRCGQSVADRNTLLQMGVKPELWAVLDLCFVGYFVWYDKLLR